MDIDLHKPFVLPEDPSSSLLPEDRCSSTLLPMEKILEDPGIQTALNGIYQWAIENRIPTKSLFGNIILLVLITTGLLLKEDIMIL
ncbi:hypothetical protein RCL1_007485 [Eukaryota sp. TZLM3-RCL]